MKNGSKIIESIEDFRKVTDVEPGKDFEELKLKADIQPVASFNLTKVIQSTQKHLEDAKKNLEPCVEASDDLIKDTATEDSKDRFKTPKEKDLKAMGLSEGVKRPTARVLNEATLDDRVFLGSIKLGDTEYFVTGDKTHTRNYHYEEVKIEGRDKNSFSGYSVVGFGRYRWMNRPWQKYEFAAALESAFIDWQPNHKEEIRKIVEENSSAKGALVQLAKMLGGVLEESLKEDKSTKELSKEQIANIYKELDFSDKENIERAYFRKDGDKEQLVIEYTDEKGIKGKYEPTLEKEQLDVILKEAVEETKPLKESIESEIFYDHFGATSLEFQDVVKEILKRLELEDLKKKILADEDISEEVYEAMDAELIYTDDQWECMKHYQSPKDANFDQMWEDLTTDIIVAIENWAKGSED